MIDKIFPRKLNRSKDARIQDKTEMYSAVNVSIDDFDGNEGGADGTGDAGVIKPAKGNSALTQPEDLLSNSQHMRVLGSVSDEVNNEVYLFVFSTVAAEHGVYKINSLNELERFFTSEYFQFDQNGFVKGDIVYKQDGSVILYFTDGKNEPRKINLSKLTQEDVDDASAATKIDFITACPKTPMHPPTFAFEADETRAVNFRSVEGFQFAYQCIYNGGEESAISTYSNVAVPPPYLVQGSLSDPTLEAANVIRVTVPDEVNNIKNYTENIVKIRLLVRIGNNGAFFVVSEKSPGADFLFYNDSVLTGVPQEDQDKLHDALPRKASAQTVVNDRLIYGDYTEGYETPQVRASFQTRNIERPEDFVDLRIGIRPLISPVFAANTTATVSLQDEDFVPSSETADNKVFNRRASYQFDLSDLPSVLPGNSVAELSFSIQPDKNFEIYNSENSYHAFRNNGFGLSLDSSDKNISSNTRVVKSDGSYGQFGQGENGSPAVFQNQSPGVQKDGLTWVTTDPNALEQQTGEIKFGTSPSNPFIIPKEFVKFKMRFKIQSEVDGPDAVKSLVEDLLIRYFSDEQGVESHPSNNVLADADVVESAAGRNPEVQINQLMDSSQGFGLISDKDPRARTVVSCFSEDEASSDDNIAPCGFFAINKAKATFALRHNAPASSALLSNDDLNVGPIFTLHIKDLSDVETVTMIPRITRSGNRGWIYFTRGYIENSENQENVRKICVFDSDVLPPADAIRPDCNLFFLNNHFAPISNNNPEGLPSTLQVDNVVFGHQIKLDEFLNAGSLDVLGGDYLTESTFNSLQDSFFLFQGTSVISSGAVTVAVSDGNTDLDNDFRVNAGNSSYPPLSSLSFGEHDNVGFAPAGDNAAKRRIIGYLELGGNASPYNAQDPNAPNGQNGGIIHSIVDGEVNIRQNGDNGSLNPSYWYGVYYGTEFAGRNNNQFLLAEGSTSSTPVGLLHGQFSYKDFSESESATIIDELIPDVEVGRKSFSLTTSSVDVGAVGRSFKRNCDHSFAILYYDERGRPGEPVPLGSHFVPQVSDPGLAHIIVDLDSSPPDWAHSYKMLYGGNSSISDFIQYTSGGAFVPKNSDGEKGLIYVSLNHLQDNSTISYSKAFGAVNFDGDKDLYTYSEGDRLRIISYFNDPNNPNYPSVNSPYEFQVVGTTTLNDDPSENPLVVEGDEVHPAKTGQFVILKDNSEATGFSFADVAGSNSDSNVTVGVYDNDNYWNRRCVFEIFSPQKKREVESRVYYEIGKTYNVVRNLASPGVPLHQTSQILLDQGDVYFRKMAVNMQDFNETTNSFVGLIGDGTDTVDESTSPNFRSYHLESKTFTDTFPNADVLPYGKPRVAVEKFEPTRVAGLSISQGSSNLFRRYSSLKFSDRSNSNSNVVRYTSFNDSKLPFKDLQNNDGAVFFLLNQNDSIFCIQRLKCSSIPVARNILSDALGNETVIATAKVLGTEKYYAGAYGTDSSPSVAQAGNSIYFVSIRNKEVYKFNPNSGIEIISDKGMGSFFNEALAGAELGAGRVVGGYDPDSDEFVLSINEGVEVLTADFSGIPFSNAVSTLVADDFIGFEADTGSGTGDLNVDAGVIADLVNQIGGLYGFITQNDSDIADLVSDVSTIDDLLAGDFTEFVGQAIEVNLGGEGTTIPPSSIPGAYTAALESIRTDVILNITQLMQSKIDSLVALGEARYEVLDLLQAAAPLTSEVSETFAEFATAIEALEGAGFNVVPDYLSQDQRDEVFEFSDFDDQAYLDEFLTELVQLSSPLGNPISNNPLEDLTLQQLFEDVIDLNEFSIIDITVPGILPIAFVDDQEFTEYISRVTDLLPFGTERPEISDLVPAIFDAVKAQAAQNVDITSDNDAIEAAAFAAGEVAGYADGFDAGYDDGYVDGNTVAVTNFTNEIVSLNDDLALAEKRLQIMTKSLIVLGNVIDVANNTDSDDVINTFGNSLQDFVSLVDTEDTSLIEDIDAAYNELSGTPGNTWLLNTLEVYNPSSTSTSSFIQLMSQAVSLAYAAIPNPTQFTQLTDFMTGNSDFLIDSGAITQEQLSLSGEGYPNRQRVFALTQFLVNNMTDVAWSQLNFEGSGAVQPQNLGLIAEFLSAWITLGQRINLEAPGTIDLTPTTPQGLLDENTTFTLTGDNGEPVGSITFDQLVNIFRRGLISENQAKLIFKGLMGNSTGLISGATATNTIHAFDSNFDNEVGSADLLDFLVVYGSSVDDMSYNFQQFGNVGFGEEIEGGIVNIQPLANTSDSAPFQQDDVDAINIQGL
jgi:hypothetical protein